MSKHSDDTIWMTPSDAQSYLKISKTTLYDCMKDGRLPFFYVKGTRQRRIKKSDLDNLMTVGIREEEMSDDDE